MKDNLAAEYILDIDRLFETFYLKPVVHNLIERYGNYSLKEMGYFVKDAQVYLKDDDFVRSGVRELENFHKHLVEEVEPHIEEALLISPFHYDNMGLTEEEFLYRKMLSHVFKDNTEVLAGLVNKLTLLYPERIPLATTEPELVYSSAGKEKVRAHA